MTGNGLKPIVTQEEYVLIHLQSAVYAVI
jgi:hypothetical protein